MATTIDQKVVEMRFDNSDFERNTRQSMSTLDKLKEKLHFKGAADGLDDFSKAAKKVNMNHLSDSIQTISAKFSAMEVIGTTALVNITNQAVNAAKQMAKSLLGLESIKAGFDEYSMTMNTVQTLVNSTGKSVKEVEGYLKQLDDYADKTVYSTADMFNNIYKFTNAGISLEDAKTAMIGIANATAYAGQGAQQASIAYYNLAQSMSMGYLTTIDYKSLNLANIATKDFKQNLADAAIANGTLKKTSKGMYKTQKGTYTLQSLFTEGLKDQWATTKVMMDVFKKYGSQETEIGKKAWAAAQEVKTFGMAIETLKAQAGTGWKETWQHLFGGLDDAKRVWTGLTNFIGRFLNVIDNWRNRLLNIAMNNPLKDLFDKINANPIISSINKVDKKVKNSSHTLAEYQKMVDRIWRGDFKNQPYRKALVEAEGYNYSATQSLVNLGANRKGYYTYYRLTQKDIEKAEKKYGVIAQETTTEVKKEQQAIEELTDAQLKKMGLTEEEIKTYRDLEKGAKKYGMTIEDLAKKMSNVTGRDLLYGNGKDNNDPSKITGVFEHLGALLTNIAKAIKDAWQDVFEGITGVDLYFAIEKLNKFTEALRRATDDPNSQGMKNFRDTLKGLFSVLKLITTLMNAGFKIAWIIFKTIIETLGYDVLGFTGMLGRLVSKITDFIVNNSYLTKGIVFLTKAISKCIIKIHDMIRPFDLLHKVAEKVGNVFHKLATIMKNWYEKTGKNVLHEFLTDLANFFKGLKETDNIPKYIFQSLIKGFKKWGGKAWSGITTIFNKIFGKLNISKGDNFFEFGINCVKGLLNGLKHGAGKAIRAFADWAGNILSAFAGRMGIASPSKEFFSFGQNIVQGLWNGITSMVGIVYTLFMTICQKIIDTVKQVDLGSILAVLLAGGIVVAILKIASALKTLSGTLFDFTKNVNKVLKGFAQLEKALAAKLLMSGVKDIAIAIAIMAATVYLLSKAYKNDPEAIDHGILMVLGLGTIVAALIGVSALCAKLSSGNKLATAGLFATIIATGIAMLLMAKAAKNAKDLEWDDIKKIGVFAAMILAIVFINNITRKRLTGGLSGLGSALLGIAACMLIMGLVAKRLGEMDRGELTQGMVALAIFVLLIDTIIGMFAVVALAGGSVKIGLATFLGIALVFKTMAKVVKSLGKLPPDQFEQGIDALESFADMINLLIGLLAVLAVAQKFGGSVNNTLFGVAAMIAAMALSVKVLGEMDTGSLIQGGAAMAVMLIAIGAFIAALSVMKTSKIKNVQKTLLGVAAMIAAMSLSVYILGSMDESKLKKGMLALAGLMIMIGALIWVSGKGKNLGKGLWPVVAAIGVLVVGLAVLSMIKWQKLLPAAGALVAVMAALALVIASTNKLKKVDTKILIELGMLIAGVLVIALSLKMLAGMDPGTLLAAGAGIALILATLAGTIFILSKIKVNKDTLIAVGLMAALMLLMIPLILAIKSLTGIEGSEKTVYSLAALMGVLSLMMLALAACGDIYTVTGGLGLLLAIGGLAAILGALALMIPILKGFSKIKNAEKAVLLLTIVMGSLTALLLVLGILGPLAAVGATAMVAITALIPVFIALLAGLGLLMDKVPEMETFIDKGAVLLVKVAGVLGEVIGAFVGGLLGEMSNALPTIGENLSLFAKAASGFFSWIDSLSLDILGKATLMTGVIMLMTAADLLASITAFIKKCSGTENGLVMLGVSFSAFAMAITPFMKMVEHMPKNALSAVKDLTEVILMLTAASVLDAITKFLSFGKSDLSTFAESLPILGSGFASFAKSLGKFDDGKIKTIECGAQAIAAFGEVSKKVSGNALGNVVRNIVSLVGGDTDLSLFASSLEDLGEGFAAFAGKLKDENFTEENVKLIEVGVKAIEKFAEVNEVVDDGVLANIIENIIDAFGGESDMEQFADSIAEIGSALAVFGRKLNRVTDDGRRFDPEQVTKALEVLEDIAYYTEDIEYLGSSGTFQESAENLSESLGPLGTGLRTFMENVSGISNEDLSKGQNALKIISEVLSQLKSGITTGLKDTLNEWGEGSISQAISNFFSEISEMCDINSDTWSGDITNAGRTAGITISDNVALGVEEALTGKEGNTAIGKIASAIAGIFGNESVKTTAVNSAKTLGNNIADGLINTIKSPINLARAYGAGYTLFKAFDKGVRKTGDINSPSKEAAKLGNYTSEGFIMGISQYSSQVYNVGENVANEAKRGLASAISSISNLVNSDMNANPTIRPILDLSNVTDGIGQMNSMFSNSSLTSNLGAISTGMNSRIQNGNSDVVSAIDKLGKNLGNNGTTYNINGITYDDNNNINKAVQDLVRAIEVERRV